MSARIRERHKIRAKLAESKELRVQLGEIEMPNIGDEALSSMSYPPHRHIIGRFLNAHNLVGEGAEVGVLHGSFSLIIMQSWTGRCLHLVDPWCRQDPTVYTEPTNDANWDDNLRIVMQRMDRFGPRVTITRSFSKDAVSGFKDGQLDWVYIDANHRYESVLEDLTLWYPKVRRGGLVGGHDYGDNAHCVVKMAVDKFRENNKLGPINGLGSCSSFWIWKPK